MVLKYVEFHVADKCNLNCNCCSHFSPLVREDFDHYEDFARDITRLRELFPRIGNIRLLGGEPFLDPRLDRYAGLARRLYPQALIEVATNGLLILSASDRVLQALRDNRIVIMLTLYPPTIRLQQEILDRLNAWGIECQLTDVITTFRKRLLPDGTAPQDETFETCGIGRTCTFVYGGKLYLCSGAALIKYFNGFFGKNLVFHDCAVDLYAKDTTAEKILDFLSHSNESCRYCGRICEESWSCCGNPEKIDIRHWLTEDAAGFC